MTPIEEYIRSAAIARGIDPDIAVRVARSEGGVDSPNLQSYVGMKSGDREQSYGPFQLNVRGGLGASALKRGIDPRDPSQWKQGVDFALDEAASGGWGPWHGAQAIGLSNRAGIGGGAKARGISLATPAKSAPALTPDFSGPTSNPDAGLTSAAGFIHPTSNPDAAMVSAAGMSQPFKPKNPFSGVQPGLSAPMPPPVAPMAPPVPAPAAAGGMGGMGGLLSGLGSLASSLGGSSQSDPSANQLEPSSIDINRPSASAAAQMMAQLIEDRRKRYKMGTTLTGMPNA